MYVYIYIINDMIHKYIHTQNTNTECKTKLQQKQKTITKCE